MVAITVQRVLRPEGYDVDVALGGAAALEQARAHRPDLVVLDLMMPGIDGLEVCRQLRAGGSLPILMLTARSGTADRVRGLDTGADDYLIKPFAYTELLARVRALLRRAAPPSTLLQFADLTLEVETREVRRSGRLVQLTAKEFALLTHFLRHPRLVLTRDQLLSAVWADEETDDNVVAVYVGYLRTKLDGAGEPRLIQTVRGFGYSLREAGRVVQTPADVLRRSPRGPDVAGLWLAGLHPRNEHPGHDAGRCPPPARVRRAGRDRDGVRGPAQRSSHA